MRAAGAAQDHKVCGRHPGFAWEVSDPFTRPPAKQAQRAAQRCHARWHMYVPCDARACSAPASSRSRGGRARDSAPSRASPLPFPAHARSRAARVTKHSRPLHAPLQRTRARGRGASVRTCACRPTLTVHPMGPQARTWSQPPPPAGRRPPPRARLGALPTECHAAQCARHAWLPCARPARHAHHCRRRPRRSRRRLVRGSRRAPLVARQHADGARGREV